MGDNKEPRVRRIIVAVGQDMRLVEQPDPPGVFVHPDLLNLDDIGVKDGYIESLRIDEADFIPKESANANIMQQNLEKTSYCLVMLSAKKDAASSVSRFRIRYTDSLEGEKLAVSMAVVALLKEAFVRRTKVRLQGVLSELSLEFMSGEIVSERYFELKSVELLRT